MKPRYRSSISKTAHERVLARHPNGTPERVEYFLRGQRVGFRDFHADGSLAFEVSLKDGRPHGTLYRWDSPGKMTSAEPYSNGKPHGIARQWTKRGELLGAYTMKHGTGIDLWWHANNFHQPRLAEVYHLKDGLRHGFEWWVEKNERRVYVECHWWQGELHGIEREWNVAGRLRRSYPRYYVHGKRVTKTQYQRACRTAPELPPFNEADNRPARTGLRALVNKFRVQISQESK